MSSSPPLSDIVETACKQFFPISEGEQGKILHIHDGDTFTFGVYREGVPYKFNCRVRDIDTPELWGSPPTEKRMATYARTKLEELIKDKIVTFTKIDLDKYGRILAEVTVDGINVSAEMIKFTSICHLYQGDTKTKWVWTQEQIDEAPALPAATSPKRSPRKPAAAKARAPLKNTAAATPQQDAVVATVPAPVSTDAVVAEVPPASVSIDAVAST